MHSVCYPLPGDVILLLPFIFFLLLYCFVFVGLTTLSSELHFKVTGWGGCLHRWGQHADYFGDQDAPTHANCDRSLARCPDSLRFVASNTQFVRLKLSTGNKLSRVVQTVPWYYASPSYGVDYSSCHYPYSP